MAAIRLLHDLQIENRLAIPEEQETLAKYVGWGGLSMAFDEKNAAWANEKLPERDIAKHHVKVAVWELCVLKSLNGDAGFLVELLCNSAR